MNLRWTLVCDVDIHISSISLIMQLVELIRTEQCSAEHLYDNQR